MELASMDEAELKNLRRKAQHLAASWQSFTAKIDKELKYRRRQARKGLNDNIYSEEQRSGRQVIE